MQELQVWSLGQKNPPEKEMATHSSILAWVMTWTEKPGGLQSVGSQKSQTWLSNYTTTMSFLSLFIYFYVVSIFCLYYGSSLQSSRSCTTGVFQINDKESAIIITSVPPHIMCSFFPITASKFFLKHCFLAVWIWCVCLTYLDLCLLIFLNQWFDVHLFVIILGYYSYTFFSSVLSSPSGILMSHSYVIPLNIDHSSWMFCSFFLHLCFNLSNYHWLVFLT